MNAGLRTQTGLHGVLSNAMLAQFPRDILQRWLTVLEPVDMPAGMILYPENSEPVYLYFPTTAIVSLAYQTRRGINSHFAVIGREGFIGAFVFMGSSVSPFRSVVQAAGQGYRVLADNVAPEFRSAGPVVDTLLKFVLALSVQIAQTVVCNKHHDAHSQLSRWLLMSLDRTGDPVLMTTHTQIAETLGLRRETVTTGARALQDQGLIECHRGAITILNRTGLEADACECYFVLKREYRRLLGSDR